MIQKRRRHGRGEGGLAVKKKGKGTPYVLTNSKRRAGEGGGKKVGNFVRRRFWLAPSDNKTLGKNASSSLKHYKVLCCQKS